MAEASYHTSGHDQAKTRSYVELTDQHGRQWDGIIDVKSHGTIGPLMPRFQAPLEVPQKYLKRAQFNRIHIDYERWISDIDAAHREYERITQLHANQMFGDQAAAAIASRNPALMHRIGPPPQYVQPVLAAAAGEYWVLGLVGYCARCDETHAYGGAMPSWAVAFFPQPKPAALVAEDRLAFLRPTPQEPALDEQPTFPHAYAPGRWRLSNGETVKGKKAEAEQAEAALHAHAGAHPSWGE